MKTQKCRHCGNRTTSSNFGGYCNSHKWEFRRLYKAAKAAGHLVDQAGGGWWVWDKIGNVLGCGNSPLGALLDEVGVMS